MKLLRAQKGQGMLEMIFSIGILIMAVLTILALSFSNATGQKESEYQVIANNLAREGIEIVRNKRDSNWLSGANWDSGLSSGTYTAEFDPAQNLWQLVLIPPAGASIQLYQSSDGIYSHKKVGQATIYSRMIELRDICQGQIPSNLGVESIRDGCNSLEKKIGLRVVATVDWKEKNRSRFVALEDLLYDWK